MNFLSESVKYPIESRSITTYTQNNFKVTTIFAI